MLYPVCYLFPLVAYAIALFCGADTEAWYVYLIFTAAAEGLIYLCFYLLSRDTEYLSGYVVETEHHFAWTERVEYTESHTDSKGNVHTERKVRYVHHPDEYFWILNTGKNYPVSAGSFHELCRRWGTGTTYIAVYHPNCVSGGGGECCRWDGDEYNTHTATYTQRYKNPVQDSSSIFRGSLISKKKAKELGLMAYPKIRHLEQEVVLVSDGLEKPADWENANFELQHLNAFEGSTHEIHAFILLFPADKGPEIALKQRDYWEGLNKNEFVVCLGVNEGKVVWCMPMSWMDAPTLESNTKAYFREHESLDLLSFVSWLRSNLYSWKRKEFKDFSYLGIHLSPKKTVLFVIISIVLSVLLCWGCFAMGMG